MYKNTKYISGTAWDVHLMRHGEKNNVTKKYIELLDILSCRDLIPRWCETCKFNNLKQYIEYEEKLCRKQNTNMK